MRTGLHDQLKELKLEAFKRGTAVAIRAPSWLISDKIELEDLIEDFEEDEAAALRDHACVPLDANRPFFPDGNVLAARAQKEYRSPLDPTNLSLADWFQPLEHRVYAFSGDLSVSGDRTGISLVHYDWVTNRAGIDFTAAIGGHGSVVDYGPIRALVRNLTERGFRIAAIGFDQFQSHDIIMSFINEGYEARVVNYSETMQGCSTLRDMIINNRFDYGACEEIFIGEASELQVVNSRRVDHQKTTGFLNSKDVWDSVVNNVCLLLELKAKQADNTDFVLPENLVRTSFVPNADFSFLDDDNRLSYALGLTWGRRETAVVCVCQYGEIVKGRLPKPDHVRVFQARTYPYSRVSAELVGFLRQIISEYGPAPILLDSTYEFAIQDLSVHGFRCAKFDATRLSNEAPELLRNLFLSNRLLFNESFKPLLLAPLLNFHRDATGKLRRDGAALPLAVALALLGCGVPGHTSNRALLL